MCIHGHFYQPPRENPWLEEIELQDSAYPYHDWNERITAECYAPNTASRILGPEWKIIDIVNNFSKISFNFGPTLLAWMQRRSPEVYQAVLDADKESKKNFGGHGSAIAQCYNHMIMPLANQRDKRTQIIWGVRDFEYRFGRKPEGMWLPETAVDLETLDILSENGIKFTILAPHQAKQVRKIDGTKWIDVSGTRIDPKMPYLCRLPSGRTIVLFFYDGPVSQQIAFSDILLNGENFAKRLVSTFVDERNHPQLCHIATDGETYGHHHRSGDMALSYCLYYTESNNLARLTVYSEYLEKNSPAHEVEIFENSSWSCIHGIERWRSACGCNSGMHQHWNQGWRAPLKNAMDWLQDNLIHIYEEQASQLVHDPWQTRDDYIEVVLDRSTENVERFFSTHCERELMPDEKVKVLKLLEMQRHAMLMYTSCGWFFDEISSIESVQVMEYAARAIQLTKETSGVSLEEVFISLLERAPSNIAEFKNGAKVYESLVKPAVLNLLRVGVHYAVSSLFKEHSEFAELYSYTAKSQVYDLAESGKQKLAAGIVHVRSKITWEEGDICFAVLYIGGHDLIGGARALSSVESFSEMHKALKDNFMAGELTEALRLIDKHFNHDGYSLWHLFKDEQRRVLNQIFDSALKDIESTFRRIFEHHSSIVQAADKVNIPLPKPFAAVAEFVLNSEIGGLLENEVLNVEKLKKHVDEIQRFSLTLDKATINFIASEKINELMVRFSKDTQDASLLENIVDILNTIAVLPLDLNLWKAQNMYFSIGKQLLGAMREKEASGDAAAKDWVEHFRRVGDYLKVRIE